MKKKLLVSRETIRHLNNLQLTKVNGGLETHETCDHPCPGRKTHVVVPA